MSENGSRLVAEDAIEWLNAQQWHDSILHEVRLIRTNSVDEVVLVLDLIIDWQEYTSQRMEITFEKCYLVRTEMNWGIGCMSTGEMINAAKSKVGGELTRAARDKWQGQLNLPVLCQFSLDLASTDSRLDIEFESIRWQETGDIVTHSAPPPLPIKPK